MGMRDTVNRMTIVGLMGFVAVCVGAGCVVEAGPEDCDCDCEGSGGGGGWAGTGGSAGSGSGQVVVATVDTGQTLETAPGEGIGVFIEYAEGGQWPVFTACDSNISGMGCAHNVAVFVPATSWFGGIRYEGLEGADTVYEYSDGLELATETTSDLDGVYFDTDPGTTVRFETWLDGAKEAGFVYWVGGGAIHGGAPSNPIDLRPSAP